MGQRLRMKLLPSKIQKWMNWLSRVTSASDRRRRSSISVRIFWSHEIFSAMQLREHYGKSGKRQSGKRKAEIKLRRRFRFLAFSLSAFQPRFTLNFKL